MTATELPAYSPELAAELRAGLGWTHQQMADALRLSGRSKWADIEHGRQAPSAQTWALALIVGGRHPSYGPRA